MTAVNGQAFAVLQDYLIARHFEGLETPPGSLPLLKICLKQLDIGPFTKVCAASIEKPLQILACPPPNAPNRPRPQTLVEAELWHHGGGAAVPLDVMQAHMV